MAMNILQKNANRVRSELSLVPPKVRRVRLPFGEEKPMDHFFANGNIALSHLAAVISGVFPTGEDSLIRSARRFSGEIDDPVMKKRVAGFIGQESTHGQEHNRLNQTIHEMGTYPIASWLFTREEFLERTYTRLEEFAGRMLHLGFMAMLEHGTATATRRLLTSEELQSMLTDPNVRGILNWHALEELEHKSVLFDLYQHKGGSELVRVVVVGLPTVLLFYPFLFGLTLASALGDPAARRQPMKFLRDLISVLRGPLGPGVILELGEFLKPGWHPEDIDTEDLVQEWQLKLFGANGDLVDRVR